MESIVWMIGFFMVVVVCLWFAYDGSVMRKENKSLSWKLSQTEADLNYLNSYYRTRDMQRDMVTWHDVVSTPEQNSGESSAEYLKRWDEWIDQRDFKLAIKLASAGRISSREFQALTEKIETRRSRPAHVPVNLTVRRGSNHCELTRSHDPHYFNRRDSSGFLLGYHCDGKGY